jgi:hypothetical protein
LWSVPGCRSRRASRFPQVEGPIYRHCVAILAEPKSSNYLSFCIVNRQLTAIDYRPPTYPLPGNKLLGLAPLLLQGMENLGAHGLREVYMQVIVLITG